MAELSLKQITDKLKISWCQAPGPHTIDNFNNMMHQLNLEPVEFQQLFQEWYSPLKSVQLFLEEQIKIKEEKATAMRIKRSGMPPKKTMEGFDFGFQQSITKEQMLRLSDFTWLEEAYNVMLLGPPSVGKSHSNFRHFLLGSIKHP